MARETSDEITLNDVKENVAQDRGIPLRYARRLIRQCGVNLRSLKPSILGLLPPDEQRSLFECTREDALNLIEVLILFPHLLGGECIREIGRIMDLLSPRFEKVLKEWKAIQDIHGADATDAVPVMEEGRLLNPLPDSAREQQNGPAEGRGEGVVVDGVEMADLVDRREDELEWGSEVGDEDQWSHEKGEEEGGVPTHGQANEGELRCRGVTDIDKRARDGPIEFDREADSEPATPRASKGGMARPATQGANGSGRTPMAERELVDNATYTFKPKSPQRKNSGSIPSGKEN